MFGSAGQGLVTALVFDCDGVLADTERYGHLPAFNQMFARVRRCPSHWCEEEYGREAADRRRQGADGEPVRRPSSCAAAGLPERPGGRRRRCSPTGTGARPRIYTAAGRRRASCPAAPGHPPDRRRGAGRGLDAGGRLHLGRGVGARGARARRRHGARRAVRRRLAGDVVAGARSPRPTSTCSPLDRLGLDRRTTLVVEDSRNGLLAADRRRACAASSPSTATPRDEDFDEAVAGRLRARRPRRRADEVLADRADVDPGDLVTLDDLRPACARTPIDARQRGRMTETRRPTTLEFVVRTIAQTASTTRSTSAISTRSSATATSATRWPAASRRCSKAGTASTAPTPARS